MSSQKSNVTAQPLQSLNISFQVGNTLQRPSSPPNGYTRTNSQTNYIEIYYNNQWVNMLPIGLTTVDTGIRTRTSRAIFGYGQTSPNFYSMTNLVTNTGVVGTDVTGVGTARFGLGATSYGYDKAIFGYGATSGTPSVAASMTNLVSNTGVVATDTTGVGTARRSVSAAGYGNFGQAIFGYGGSTGVSTLYSLTNLVSNTGIVATDTTGVGTARYSPAAASYGFDKAIFGYGVINTPTPSTYVSMTNLVSNTGVVATDTTGVGTARGTLAASGYGDDKAIFGYGTNGSPLSTTNKVSNTGVVAIDTQGVGFGMYGRGAAVYGIDKAIFAYGATTNDSTTNSNTNLVSNQGIVAADTSGAGTIRWGVGASGYGT